MTKKIINKKIKHSQKGGNKSGHRKLPQQPIGRKTSQRTTSLSLSTNPNYLNNLNNSNNQPPINNPKPNIFPNSSNHNNSKKPNSNTTIQGTHPPRRRILPKPPNPKPKPKPNPTTNTIQ